HVAPLYLHSFPTRRSSDLIRPSFATQNIWTGKWGRCKRDCSGEHITTVTEVIQFGRPIISSVLSPVPGHKPIPRCDRAQVSCWRSEEHTSELQSRGHLVCR